MFQYFGYSHKQFHIQIRTLDYFVSIADITMQLVSKPAHSSALPLQFRRHHLSDVQFMYLLLFCHKKSVNYCLSLRFRKKPMLQTRKLTDKPRAFQLSCVAFYEIFRISTMQRKAKTLFITISKC